MNKNIRIEIAKSVLDALGGYKGIKKIFPDATGPAICLWKTRGIPLEKERFLRAAYPNLPIWSKYVFGCGYSRKQSSQKGE